MRRVPVIQVAASEATSRFVPLGIGKSVAIDLPADIKDVLVADPKIANAVDPLVAPRLHDRRHGRPDQHLLLRRRRPADRRLRHRGDARPQRRARRAQAELCPNADIRIEGVGDGVMLSGIGGKPGRSRSRHSISPRGWSATAPRWSTASPCAAAIR